MLLGPLGAVLGCSWEPLGRFPRFNTKKSTTSEFVLVLSTKAGTRNLTQLSSWSALGVVFSVLSTKAGAIVLVPALVEKTES